MKSESIFKRMRINMLAKISITFCVLMLGTFCILEYLSVRSSRLSNTATAEMMGRAKLLGDLEHFRKMIEYEYGALSLVNGTLVDAHGNSIKNDFAVVDSVSKSLGVRATIFVRENQDYRRISTSIVDNSGKRAVDTLLGSGGQEYSSVQSGRDYIGRTVILGNNYLSVYRPLFAGSSRDVIGILFIGIPLQSIEKYIIDTRNSSIISAVIESLIIIAVSMVIIYFLVRSIIKPIKNVTLTLKDISEGEGDLTKEISIDTNDEVSDLSRYFNLTLEKIRSLVNIIKKQAMVLSNVGDGLATDMNETAAAINEITANIKSMKDRIQTQSTTVSETHVTMEELTRNINKLDDHVENQNSHVSQASAAIEEMVANVQSVTNTLIKNASNVKSLRDASEVGRSGLQDVASDIQEITRESEGLLEINSVIDNIASQTNLLSMNAAIEAAHAGEAGKGFAVVAEEIRKLAENSSEQSKTIGTVLNNIKTSIDKITHSANNVLQLFEAIDSNVKIVSEQEEIIRNAMEEQGAGSKQILDGVSEVNNITRSVKSGSQEMLEEAKEVIVESEKLEKTTQEINSGMIEMSMGVEQINLAVNDVNDLSIKNRDGLDILIKEVSRFKIE